MLQRTVFVVIYCRVSSSMGHVRVDSTVMLQRKVFVVIYCTVSSSIGTC